ncbi:unnamed protein product [Sympodiomycopsis kandeliae]
MTFFLSRLKLRDPLVVIVLLSRLSDEEPTQLPRFNRRPTRRHFRRPRDHITARPPLRRKDDWIQPSLYEDLLFYSSLPATTMSEVKSKMDAAQVPIPLPDSSLFFHPAVLILVTVVSSQVLKLIGNQGILTLISPIHLRLLHGSTLSRQRALKKELFQTRQQLNQTSSQDEFAKWAKLRRKVDKILSELEAVNNSLASSKSSLSLLVKGIMFALSTMVPFAVTTWFRKTPIFWLPPSVQAAQQSSGWALGKTVGPAGAWMGPLGWVLSLPSAPRGSVSATVWSQVCSRVVALIFTFIADALITMRTLGGGGEEHSAQRSQTLAQPNRSLQSIWYSMGLATCSFAFSQLEYLEEIAGMDLSSQFGGHYAYLTNCGLVCTFITLLLSLTTVVAPDIPFVSKAKTMFSIITLPAETMITILYWTVLAIDPSLLVPSKQVADPSNPGQFLTEAVRLPLGTDLCMHFFPAVLLLVDFLIFSPPFPKGKMTVLGLSFPHITSLISTLAYCTWAEVCNYHNGHYPYPLLSLLSNLQRTALYLFCAFLIVAVTEFVQIVHRVLDAGLNRTWIVPNQSASVRAKKNSQEKEEEIRTVPTESKSSAVEEKQQNTTKRNVGTTNKEEL